MAQYDVYVNPSARLRDEYPYLVDLQSDLLSALDTRLVAPLAASGTASGGLPRRLSPVFNIEGRQVVMVPQETSAVLKRVLKSPVVSLRAEHALLVDALDAVISGI